jgi:hypothetical protein
LSCFAVERSIDKSDSLFLDLLFEGDAGLELLASEVNLPIFRSDNLEQLVGLLPVVVDRENVFSPERETFASC